MLKQLLRLTLLSAFLLAANLTFSQNNPPVLIPYAQDTLVGISQHQFDVVLFGFSYLNQLEETSKITSKQLSRLDSIITLQEKELSLERLKMAQKDSIALNLQEVIKCHQKAAKKKALKNTLLNIALGVGLAAETAIIIQLLR